jgi:hypothetical protein
VGIRGFFFFQFCEVGGLVNYHPQEDLATFGYRSKRKVDFFCETPLHILTNMQEPMVEIWEFQIVFPSKHGDFGAIFSSKNPSTSSRPFFWVIEWVKFCHKKKLW